MTKTRYFGGWSNSRCGDYMRRCHELLESIEQQTLALSEQTPERPTLKCPHCDSQRLELIEERAKPSWKELFWREGEACPTWYADLQREGHRRFWTAANGPDYYDWYLETQLEVAKKIDPGVSPPSQLCLFEMPPTNGYLLNSF